MSAARYVCIHGHFYQPPRENPWLEAVETQDSAAPYHDWNERITRECYGPNSRARLVDHQGKIIDLINNYAWMSFNFGPTLLSWMEQAAPDVLRGVIEGDRLSRARRGGHGNALAQVYNHVILPLASPHDKRTQVAWGIADFHKRFGREPEGMWLAETGVDLASLEALAAAGIRFTILAPRQALRWRKLGDEKWTEAPVEIDPSRAYLCRLPSARTIALFFFDGRLAREVAFEGLLASGEKFLARILESFDPSRPHAQLVHLATDGESYGHHHPHGDMALAYVLSQIGRRDDVRLTNYAEFLERHPPEWEVEIRQNSSWSCPHGVERWRSDCGCNMGRGWRQDWRGPLRQAFDVAKDRLDRLLERRGRDLFTDPWAARDDYVQVILDRGEASVRRFLAQHARPKPPLTPLEVREVLWLLEMQRNALLTYTSCGWFFDEISGLETSQCLHYAARALQLARHFEADHEEEFLRVLEKAPSNVPRFRTGRGVWEQMVRPATIDLDRVLVHYAITLIYRSPEVKTRVYCYHVEALDQEVRGRGESQVAVGLLKVRSQLTWNEAETAFVVLHFGGLDFHAALRKARSVAEYQSFKKELFRRFTTGSMADVTALVMREFEGEAHRLDDLFLEEKRRVIGIVLQDRFGEYQQAFERLADQDEAVRDVLARLSYPIPRPLRLAAGAALDRRLRDEVAALREGGSVARIKDILDAGKLWGYQPEERESLRRRLGQDLHGVIGTIGAESDLPMLTAQADRLVDAAALLGVGLDLWDTQNHLLDAYARLTAAGPISDALRRAFGHLADRLNINPDLLGWRP
jgi:alpha-amylase/alpha-mannosidase (GH57 family)